MAIQTKIQLKERLETGDPINQSICEDLVDSLAHIDDIGAAINQTPKDPAGYNSTAQITHFWYNHLEKATDANGDKAVKIFVACASATNLEIVYAKDNGGNADILKTLNFSAVSGINEFDLDDSGVVYSGDIWIAVKNDVAALRYQGGVSGGNGKFFTGDNQPIGSGDYDFCFWMGYSAEAVFTIPEPIKTATGQQDLGSFDLQAEINNNRYVVLPAGDINITSTINIPSNTKIVGVKGATRLILQNNGVGLQINGTNNISISGLNIVGQGANISITNTTLTTDAEIAAFNGIGSEIGLKIIGSNVYNLDIRDLLFENLTGVGMDITAANNQWRGNGYYSNIMAKYCYMGVRLSGGVEYSNYAGIRCHECYIGMGVYGGNNFVSNSNFTYCRIGFIVGDGSNAAHGTLINTPVNHCELYGIHVIDIDNGFCFVGCHTWDSVFRLVRCNGTLFSGCLIGGEIEMQDVTFAHFIGNSAPANYNAFTITETGTNNYQLDNNHRLNGTLIT